MDLRQVIRQALADCHLIPQAATSKRFTAQAKGLFKTRVLVALSGGADSSALLIALSQIADQEGLEILACHVNHQIRGIESEEDEKFCLSLCHTLNLNLDVRKDTDSNAPGNARSEEALRSRRYDLLLAAARQAEVRYLLTAHTLDDQIETVLFRLWRGTSLRGLAGIALRRPLSDDVCLIRPLLSINKDQCRQFLAEQGFTSREDSSNQDSAYTRNYLRNTIVPAVEARFGDFQQRMEQLRQIIQAEEEYLAGQTAALLANMKSNPGSSPNSWDIERLNQQPLALKRRLIAEALRQRGIEISFQRVEAIIELLNSSESIQLKRGKKWLASATLNESWQVRLTRTELIWWKNDALVEAPVSTQTVKIPGNTMVLWSGRVLRVEPFTHDEPRGDKLVFPPAYADEALVDLSGVKLPVVLRSRAPSDLIQPLGMSQKVRLKQYLHTHKRKGPDQLLSSSPILLADQEEVLWVPGIGLSEKIRVKGKPSHRLTWLSLSQDQSSLA